MNNLEYIGIYFDDEQEKLLRKNIEQCSAIIKTQLGVNLSIILLF